VENPIGPLFFHLLDFEIRNGPILLIQQDNQIAIIDRLWPLLRIGQEQVADGEQMVNALDVEEAPGGFNLQNLALALLMQAPHKDDRLLDLLNERLTPSGGQRGEEEKTACQDHGEGRAVHKRITLYMAP
jgi:hypothetical protein